MAQSQSRPTPSAALVEFGRVLRPFLARHSPLVILAGLCLLLAIGLEDFRHPENLANVMRRTCVVALTAIGQTLVIITAGIDLSVGSVAALAGAVTGILIVRADMPMPVALAAGIGVGAVIGLVNGLITTKGRIAPFITTLGTMMAVRGAVLLITDNQTVFIRSESFKYLGGTRGWWIPVVLTLGLMLVVTIILNATRYGRALYATGGNTTGARLSGIAIDRVRTWAYIAAASMAALAGCVLASLTGTAAPLAAQGLELQAIAACVIGGASLMGGQGGVAGAVAGALIMEVLVNFCNLQGLNRNWQYVIVGALVVVLVMYDTWRKRRSGLLQE